MKKEDKEGYQINSSAIKRLCVGPFQVNAYIVKCRRTSVGFIIDPGGEEDRIISLAAREHIDVRYILNTHGHVDHVLGNEALKKAFNAETCMHETDDDLFARSRTGIAAARELGFPPPAPADRRLKEGDIIQAGDLSVHVIHTPGHTPGSVCYLLSGNLFTGDTLFVGAIGRTDLIGGSFETLLDSLKTRLLPLSGDTIVWPGHDYGETPTSTLAREKEENPYITDFILSQ